MEKGDILGHEFCGIVESVGRAVKKVQIGRRYVASFQIACGTVRTRIINIMNLQELLILLC